VHHTARGCDPGHIRCGPSDVGASEQHARERPDLPEPDAVFIGGSGGGFEEIVKLCAVRAHRAVVLTLISLERVVPAVEILEDRGLEVETAFLQVSRMKGVGSLHRLAAGTPVFVVSGSRP